MSPELPEDFVLGFLREWRRLDDHSSSIKVLERVKKIA